LVWLLQFIASTIFLLFLIVASITCEKMFDRFRLIRVFVGVIGVIEGPCGGITHVLGALERLKINA
jgi:hypothetical protein